MAAAKRLIVCRSFTEAPKSARGPSKKLPHASPPPPTPVASHTGASIRAAAHRSNSTSSPSTSVQCTCTCSTVQSQLSRRPQAGHECRWPPPTSPLPRRYPTTFGVVEISSHRIVSPWTCAQPVCCLCSHARLHGGGVSTSTLLAA